MTERAGARKLTLAELGQALDAPVRGDAGITVSGIDHPSRAGPDQLALAVEPAALKLLATGKARAAVVAADAPEESLVGLAAWIAVKQSRVALSVLTRLFVPPSATVAGIHPTAFVDPSAVVDANASIGALAFVGSCARIGARSVVMPHATIGADAILGEDCIVRPGVRVGERVSIGNRVILHDNCCVGSEGFSFATPERSTADARSGMRTLRVAGRNDRILKIHSLGTVVIEDDVEVGACTTIDRATLGATVVRRGTKIDNQVQIAHNCAVGENCLIAGQVGLAGSVRVGDRAVLAGQAGIADHVTIGDDAVVGGAAAVSQSVPPGTTHIGYPAMPAGEKLQEVMNIRRLSRLLRDVVELGKRLGALERRTASPRGE